MDELEIDGKIYLSSKAAAKLTGYAKDYVGQLCREGRVNARLVGRSWYVLEESIKSHRFGQESEIRGVDEKKDENIREKEEEIFGESSEEKENTPKYNVDFEHTYFRDNEEVIEEAPILPQEENFVSSEMPQEEVQHITAMQDVWKEWFDHKGKQKEETAVSDAVVENSNDKDTSYLLDSSEEIESKEESVPLHIVHKEKERVAVEVDYMAPMESKEYATPVVETHSEVTKIRPQVKERPQASFLAFKAGVIGVVFVFVSITLIALGFFEPVGAENNPVYLYLSGETKI